MNFPRMGVASGIRLLFSDSLLGGVIESYEEIAVRLGLTLD